MIEEKAGGREAVLACGGIFTGPYEVQALAWHLHVHGQVLVVPPGIEPPGTVFAGSGRVPSGDRRFRVIGRSTMWVVRRNCRR